MKGAGGLDINDYFGVVKRGYVNGKLYQLPLGVSTPILYYNTEAAKAAGLEGGPKTWDELFDTWIPKLTVKDGSKTSVYGYAFLANADWWWQQSYPWMYGGQLSDEKFNTYFDTQPVIDFLDRFQQRFKAGEAYLPTSADGGASAYFGSGKANVLIEFDGCHWQREVACRRQVHPRSGVSAGRSFRPQGTHRRHGPVDHRQRQA